MAETPPLPPFVPGFDFLQGLMKNAHAALPGIGQWIAPTLDPQELEKRIEELRTVQFWLEQNARMLGATIQALEVQRMTLTTLRTMNVQMDDLRESLKVKLPADAPASAAKKTPKAAPEAPAAKPPETGEKPSSAVDPMQWWGALTQQFTQLAASAVQEGANEAAKNLAGLQTRPPAPAPAGKAAADPAPKRARRASAPKPPSAKRST